jgi:hypothetical protein
VTTHRAAISLSQRPWRPAVQHGHDKCGFRCSSPRAAKPHEKRRQTAAKPSCCTIGSSWLKIGKSWISRIRRRRARRPNPPICTVRRAREFPPTDPKNSLLLGVGNLATNPLNSLAEWARKSPSNRDSAEFPCRFPCCREWIPETGSHQTAFSATQSGLRGATSLRERTAHNTAG